PLELREHLLHHRLVGLAHKARATDSGHRRRKQRLGRLRRPARLTSVAIDVDELVAPLPPLIESPPEAGDAAPAHWQIPVCFDSDLAPDLAHVAATSGLDENEVIKAMLEVTHHVYMLGFAPGQPYMGDLPPALNIPRRENPVTRVEKGSVVTATGLTIIYAVPNPTGWHVVGRTPVEIFNLERDEAILFKPGDKARLSRIERDEFDELTAQVDDGSFDMTRLRQP
ncbi:MAG: allophanate hydrolase subunit 1, partial [SAR116 cluster bacterium]|nr:allophanate hydrolase subunit 1 [SAR116 cluster bacterium]